MFENFQGCNILTWKQMVGLEQQWGVSWCIGGQCQFGFVDPEND